MTGNVNSFFSNHRDKQLTSLEKAEQLGKSLNIKCYQDGKLILEDNMRIEDMDDKQKECNEVLEEFAKQVGESTRSFASWGLPY